VGTDLGVPLGLGNHGSGCRLHCSNDKLCDAFEYTKSTNECKISKGNGIKGDGKASNWKQVRFIHEARVGWRRDQDNLSGSEIFGDPESTNTSWGISFDNLSYSKVKIENYAGTQEYDIDDIIGKLRH